MFFKKESIKETVLDEKLLRRVLAHGEKMMAVEVRFKVGGVGAPHSHEHTQLSYVIDGKFEVAVGEEMTILKKGDSFLVPPSVIHGVVCLKEGALLDVFTPERKDFL